MYLAAVLEYLAAEILELAGIAARDRKRMRITTRDVTLAIKKDEELHHMLKDVTLSGGVTPMIHDSLLPKSAKKKEGLDGEQPRPKAKKPKAKKKVAAK